MRHTDATPGWIKRRFAKIERWQREQSAARRMEAATIGKGGVTIKDGGSLKSQYATGETAVLIGPVYPDSPADGSQITLLDDVGTPIFYAYRLPAPVSASAVYAQGDFVYLLSKTSISQVYVDDTKVQLIGGSAGVQISHSTTGASANCFIDPSDNRIWRSTSSCRYKQDIEDAEVDPADVLRLQPKTWRDKAEVEADPETERRYTGLIAEDLHDLPTMRQFVVYNEDGEPDAIAEPRLSVALLAVLKDQQATIKDLTARIEALESVDEAPAEA